VLVGATSAWLAFIVFGFGAATIASKAMVGDGRDPWWPSWPIAATMIAAPIALVALCLLAPLMYLVTAHARRTFALTHFIGAALLGAGLALIGVLVLFESQFGAVPLRPGVREPAVWSYVAAGALAGTVGWLALALMGRDRTNPTRQPSITLDDGDDLTRLPRAF